MENRKLKDGERVFILYTTGNPLINVREAQVVKCLDDKEGYESYPYSILDEYGKTHVLSYPESLTSEYIATVADYIEELRWLKERNEKEMSNLEKQNNQVDRYIKILEKRRVYG